METDGCPHKPPKPASRSAVGGAGRLAPCSGTCLQSSAQFSSSQPGPPADVGQQPPQQGRPERSGPAPTRPWSSAFCRKSTWPPRRKRSSVSSSSPPPAGLSVCSPPLYSPGSSAPDSWERSIRTSSWRSQSEAFRWIWLRLRSPAASVSSRYVCWSDVRNPKNSSFSFSSDGRVARMTWSQTEMRI